MGWISGVVKVTFDLYHEPMQLHKLRRSLIQHVISNTSYV